MVKIIDVFQPGTWEHEQLRIAAEMFTRKSRNGTKYYVGETYFDLGQDWMWTTVLAYHDDYGTYQALSPRQQEEIILRTDLDAVTDEYFTDKWCLDRE